MFRSRLEILALLQTPWTNASGDTESLSQLECHWDQKAKYTHPTSSSSKPCNSLIFPNVKQKLEWIINCPLLSRNPTNPPCFQLVFSPTCQVPPAAVKPGQSLQIPTYSKSDQLQWCQKQLCWCTQSWISVPSSRNITANPLCSSLLHYCTVPYSCFFFKPTWIGIFYVKLTHFPRATNKNTKIIFQDYWEYDSWQFMRLGSRLPKNNPKTY